MSRILAVARMSLWGLLHGRVVFVWGALLAFPLLSHRFSSDVIPSLLSSCDAAVWVAGFSALTAVFEETRQRTLAAVMVRPVACGEYFAGRALALVGVFVAFIATCILLGLALSGIGLQGSDLQQFVSQAVRGTAWIVLLVPLAGLLKPWPCAWLLMGLKGLNLLAGQFAEQAPWLAALKVLFYYGGMVRITTAEPGYWLASMLDTLGYAAVVFGLCVAVVVRMDVRLRET